MAIPHELYLRFLATKGFDDLKKVNENLTELGLRVVSQEDLDRQWNLIHSVAPKGIITQIERKSYSVDFLPCMKVLEVEDLWKAEPCVKAKATEKLCYDILQDPTLKITVNALLIKKVSIVEITRLMTAKYAVLYKEIHYDIYQRFFFNPQRLLRKDWKEYLKCCSENEKRLYFTALTEDVEVLKTELDLPAQISVSETLQWLLTKSFQKAKTYMRMNTPDANRESREWISQITILADKYEKHRSGDQSDFAKSLQMEFDFIEEDFATPDSDLLEEFTASQKGPEEAHST